MDYLNGYAQHERIESAVSDEKNEPNHSLTVVARQGLSFETAM
jgi:hypothetical protein